MDLKGLNQRTLRHARTLTYGVALLLVAAAVMLSLNSQGIATFPLSNDFGFLSFTFISLALLVTPLRKVWPAFSLNPSLNYARRALGVSGFGFALLHYVLQSTFLFQFNIQKMLAINERSGGGLAFAFLSFIMLFLLAITSTDWAVRKLGRRWFTLHSLIYLAYPLIILHAIKNGVDFSQADVFSISFSIVAAITIAFEAVRVYKDFSSKKPVPSASHTLGK